MTIDGAHVGATQGGRRSEAGPACPTTATTGRPAPRKKRPTQQRADYWMERGAADALVRLFGSRRLRPTVTLVEAAKIAGVSDRAAADAIARLRARQRPSTARRRNAPQPAPPGTKWCGYGEHFPPTTEFAPNRTSTTGLQSWCRACMVLARRDERQRQKDRRRRQARHRDARGAH